MIFQENVSFDHYFGTYPVATKLAGEPKFRAAANTPTVNGLGNALLTVNPNLNPANGAAAANPCRLESFAGGDHRPGSQYTAEQQAFDAGLMELFPVNTGYSANTVMGYFDGNTATAEWNYAQFFALSDDPYGTTFVLVARSHQAGFRTDQRVWSPP